MTYIEMFCPICCKEHKISIKKEIRTIEYKRKKIQYVNESYFCSNCNECFEDEELGNKNLNNIVDQYRQEQNLLTSNEIVNILEKYKISQKDLAILLGMGEVTITRYVTGVVQEVTNNNLLVLARDNPRYLLERLNEKEKEFGKKKVEKLRKNILSFISGKNDYLLPIIKESFDSSQDEFKGNVEFNKNKYLECIKIFLEKLGSISKVKLAKLLWYCDVLNYKKTGYGITGIVYAHMPYGALPYSFNQLVELDEIEKEIVIKEENEATYIKNVHIQCDFLSSIEKETILLVINKFKDMTSQEIVNYMHNEVAYQKTESNNPISYKYSSYVNL